MSLLILDFFRYAELSTPGTRIYVQFLLARKNGFFGNLLDGRFVATYTDREVSRTGASGGESFVSLLNYSVLQ